MGPNHPPHRKRQCLPQLPSHATARPKVQTSSICFSTGASTRPRESQDQCRSVSELLHMRFFIQHTGIILGNSTCNKIPALDLWGLTHATIASVPGRPVQSFLAFSFSFTSSQQKRSSVWIKSHGQCKIWDFLQLHYCQVDIHCHHPACLACLAYLACLACLACRHMPCHTAYHCRMVCHMACHPLVCMVLQVGHLDRVGIRRELRQLRPQAPQCFWGCFCSILEGVNRFFPLNSSYLREWSQMLANASSSFQTLKLKQQNVLHISNRPQRLYFVQETRNLRSMKWRSQKWRWKCERKNILPSALGTPDFALKIGFQLARIHSASSHQRLQPTTPVPSCGYGEKTCSGLECRRHRVTSSGGSIAFAKRHIFWRTQAHLMRWQRFQHSLISYTSFFLSQS